LTWLRSWPDLVTLDSLDPAVVDKAAARIDAHATRTGLLVVGAA
jgi:hypothetical protein